MSDLLQLERFGVSYGKVEAVHGVDLTLRQGEIVTVLGPNGAGKTTLLAAIAGAVPASSGALRWQGEPLARWSVEAMLERGLALVPESRELFGQLSVEDNLRLGAFRHWLKGRGIPKERLHDVYRIFPRLDERRTQLASTLSGGERQMLAIGRALMSQPRVLLLDEPSLGLAPLIVREVLAVVERLRETGVSVLLVEQNTRAALAIADRGYVLELGRVVAQGRADELRSDPRIAAAYLGAAAAVS